MQDHVLVHRRSGGRADALNAVINDDTTVVPVAPEAVLGEIETLLRALAVKLAEFPDTGHEVCAGAIGEERVLFDVEVSGIRLLALRLEGPPPISMLSPREQEIARMVASGYPNKTIASILEISSWTVASHLRRIFMKLQVSSRAAMATRLSGPAPMELSPLGAEPGGQASRAGAPGKET
jgi:DNA-binding CsgD family transcriptional regulator